MTQIAGVVAKGYWEPGIGDPTVIAWIIVICYLFASSLCGLLAWQGNKIGNPKFSGQFRIYWWFLAFIMLILAINKQLDIQIWLTDVGRSLFRKYGLFEQRRIFQRWFAIGVSTFCLALVLSIGWFLRRVWKTYWLSLLGIIFLLAFIIIRTASFHHVDLYLGSEITRIKIRYFLELSSIMCIATAACIGIYENKPD